MASTRIRASSMSQKNVITKPAGKSLYQGLFGVFFSLFTYYFMFLFVNVFKEKPPVRGKAAPPVLSLSSRITLIEQRLTQLEQDNDWWIDWKKDQHVKLVGQHTAVPSEDDSIEEDLVEHLENSLKL